MRELLKKAGSLALAIGALGLVLANAAVHHGCGGSRHAPAVQAAPAPAPVAAGTDPDCQMPDYMHATKAPVFLPPKCHPSREREQGSAEPAAQENEAESAPRQAP
jgi:hypothetical protein